jgi:hypothetical protein
MQPDNIERNPRIDEAIGVMAEAINLGWQIERLHEIYVKDNGVLNEYEFYYAYKAAEILKETISKNE